MIPFDDVSEGFQRAQSDDLYHKRSKPALFEKLMLGDTGFQKKDGRSTSFTEKVFHTSPAFIIA